MAGAAEDLSAQSRFLDATSVPDLIVLQHRPAFTTRALLRLAGRPYRVMTHSLPWYNMQMSLPVTIAGRRICSDSDLIDLLGPMARFADMDDAQVAHARLVVSAVQGPLARYLEQLRYGASTHYTRFTWPRTAKAMPPLIGWSYPACRALLHQLGVWAEGGVGSAASVKRRADSVYSSLEAMLSRARSDDMDGSLSAVEDEAEVGDERPDEAMFLFGHDPCFADAFVVGHLRELELEHNSAAGRAWLAEFRERFPLLTELQQNFRVRFDLPAPVDDNDNQHDEEGVVRTAWEAPDRSAGSGPSLAAARAAAAAVANDQDKPVWQRAMAEFSLGFGGTLQKLVAVAAPLAVVVVGAIVVQSMAKSRR